MTRTQIANLALDLLGESPITDYENESGTVGNMVRLHFDHTLETLLEEHQWAFGTTHATIAPGTAASVTLDPTGYDNEVVITAATRGTDGNDLTATIIVDSFVNRSLLDITKTLDAIQITTGDKVSMVVGGTLVPNLAGRYLVDGTNNGKVAFSKVGNPLIRMIWSFVGPAWEIIDLANPTNTFRSTENVVTPDLVVTWTRTGTATGTPTVTPSAATAAQIVAAAAATALEETFSLVPGQVGGGVVSAVASTAFTGGEMTILPDWGPSFVLPEDCLRVTQVSGTDRDRPITTFKILGRKLLLDPYASLEDSITIEYLTSDDSTWSATFREAFVHLLASKLAPRITGSPQIAADLLNRFRETLGKAQAKDARETKSGENHGPRAIIARSPLVRSRMRYSGETAQQ
jgi:hypothetical protein